MSTSMCIENYDPCYPDQPVVDLYLPVWSNLPAFNSKPAFIWADSTPPSTTRSSITYADLNSSVQSISNKLLSTLKRRDTVLILYPPGLHLVKIIFACQRAGLIAVPIIPPTVSDFTKQTSTYHHLLRVISQTNPKAALADHPFISKLSTFNIPKSVSWLSVDDNDDSGAVSNFDDDSAQYAGCRPDEAYLIQYTSGATGPPKPVLITAGAAAHNVRAARGAYDLSPGSTIVSWLPQYHDCGLMFLLLAVVSGATCVLSSPSSFLARPRSWLELVTEFRATCTPVPSFALPLVIRRGGEGKILLPPIDLATVRNLVLVNGPMYGSSVDGFADRFKSVGLDPSSISPSYGLAENCTFVSTAWRNATNGMPPPAYRKLLPSARLGDKAGEDVEIIVVDEESCEIVDDGVEGEIWVCSPSNNGSGYLDDVDSTREVFHARVNGMLFSGKCFLRTGDRGVVKGEERYLYVMGRGCDAVNVNEGVVHPHCIEDAAYDSNRGCLRGGCVVAFGLNGSMVVVVAELQKGREGGVWSYGEICTGIKEGVVKEVGVRVGMLRVVLVESGSVPKTTSGKLRRFMAKDMFLEGRFRVIFKVDFDLSSFMCGGEVAGTGVREASERQTVLLRSFM